MKIGVVVPFFQRKKGLLSQAIQSAFNQEASVFCIVIVDDGSPLPAREELRELSSDHREKVILIEQSNAGVSAARNRALDAMPPDVDAIAFLDPDDMWHPGHIANAIAAFEHGADFYFADFMRLSWENTRFERSGFQISAHRPLNYGFNLHAFEGNFIGELIRKNICGMPTIVVKSGVIEKVRFCEKVSAFEDLLFQCYAADNSKFVAFSSRCELFCDVGVNLISQGSWGSRRSMSITYDWWWILREISRNFVLSSDIEAYLREALMTRRSDIARLVLHRLIRFKSIDIRALIRFARSDPHIFMEFLKILAGR